MTDSTTMPDMPDDPEERIRQIMERITEVQQAKMDAIRAGDFLKAADYRWEQNRLQDELWALEEQLRASRKTASGEDPDSSESVAVSADFSGQFVRSLLRRIDDLEKRVNELERRLRKRRRKQ
ncbi:MAG TPA: hypothetical protein V6D17_06830 [Candidatus Obscuribacterales bacterium]